MKGTYFKKWGLGLCAFLITSVSYGKCYPSLDCPDDLPDSKQESPKNNDEDWQMISHYQVKGGLVKDIITGLMWMRCGIGQNWKEVVRGKEQRLVGNKHWQFLNIWARIQVTATGDCPRLKN